MKENFKNHLPLFIAIIANVIVYIPVIVFYPGFILDDFYIFKLISENPSSCITTNINESFFLFLRPISYFSFWVDFHLFGQNYFLIKLLVLSFHLTVLFLLYIIIIKVIKISKLPKDNIVLTLLLLFFSFHPDVQQWVYWIANKTELLGILFYFLSILFFIFFIEKKNTFYLILSILGFIFSILSKQNGLHLPILLLYVLLLNYKSNFFLIKYDLRLITYVSLLLLTMLAVFFLNNLFLTNQTIFYQNIWKKPFSLFGNFLFILLPLYSQTLYNFFLFNKLIVYLLVFGIVTLIILYRKQFPILLFIKILVFYLIVSFPRITSAASTRINTIYLLWVIFALYFFFTKTNNKILLFFVAILFFIGSFVRLENVNQNLAKERYLIEKLHEFLKQYPNKKIYIAGYPEPILIKNAYFYYLNRKFGTDNNVIIAPINFSFSIFEQGLQIPNRKVVYFRRELNTIKADALDPLIHFYIDDKSCTEKIVETKIGLSGRGYSEVTYNLPDSLDLNKSKIIYFNGKTWLSLD